MKKLGLGIGIALIIISVINYLNNAQQEETIELNRLQEKVTLQLDQMQQSGFTITQREMQKDREHFFITIAEPRKASVFLTQRGLRFTPEEAEELKDLQLSVDLLYLSDLFSLDIYPVALSPYLKSMLAKEKDKNILAQLDEMIKKKVLFMHVDMDHSATTFQGHIKDIDETLQGEKSVNMHLQGFHFSGNIKEEKIVKFNQTFDTAHLSMGNEINKTILGLENSYELTGPTVYDYLSEYSIEKIVSAENPENTLLAENLSVVSTSKVENGLAKETFKADSKNVDILFDKQKIGMKNLHLDMNISNIDVATLDKLQKIETEKEKEVDPLLETLISKNMHLDLSNLSAEKIILRGKEMGGASLSANLDIDSSLDIYRLNILRKHALNKMDGTIDISLSKELLDLIKEDQKAMLIYMMYRPKRELGQRLYHIKIGDGELKINGKPVDF